MCGKGGGERQKKTSKESELGGLAEGKLYGPELEGEKRFVNQPSFLLSEERALNLQTPQIRAGRNG